MPTNEHSKEVVYQTPNGENSIYAAFVRWGEHYLLVRHYPPYNQEEFLHEDRVAGIRTETKEIPREKVWEVRSI